MKNIKNLHKKFVKSRKAGKQTIEEFCRKNKTVPSKLLYQFRANGLKYPITNRRHTAESIRQVARKFEKFMANPKHHVMDFFKTASEASIFYSYAKRYGVEVHHRASRKRRRKEDFSVGIMPQISKPSVEVKKKGPFSLLSRN